MKHFRINNINIGCRCKCDIRSFHFVCYENSHEISRHDTIHDVLHGILLARHLQEHDDTAGFHFRRSRAKYDQAVVRGTRPYIVGNARTRRRARVNRRGLIADRIRDESEPYHRDPAHVARALYRDVDTIVNSLTKSRPIASLINTNAELKTRLRLVLRTIADNFRVMELSPSQLLTLGLLYYNFDNFIFRRFETSNYVYSLKSRRFNGRKGKYI